MDFKKYFFGLTVSERKVFAGKVKTTVGHLNNCAYGYTRFGPALCLAIEINSGVVSRSDLRPEDCHLIWPDLKKVRGCAAPSAKKQKA